jgi:hypothetical protein
MLDGEKLVFSVLFRRALSDLGRLRGLSEEGTSDFSKDGNPFISINTSWSCGSPEG